MTSADRQSSTIEQHAIVIGECLDELIQAPALRVSLRQRAKFEGWLKIELAHALERAGVSLSLEFTIPGTRNRADICAKWDQAGCEHQIMLKTVNTNFRFAGIAESSRPITNNIRGVIEDAEKLRLTDKALNGFLVFPIFPVASNAHVRDQKLRMYLDRLGGADLELVCEGFQCPPSSDGRWGIAWFVFRI